MNIDRSLIWGVALLGVLTAGIGRYQWVNRVQEFRGTLRDCRHDPVPAVVGWPYFPARLVTCSGRYGLDFKDYPKFEAFLDNAEGKQVVVRGILKKWRGEWQRGQLYLLVRDIRLGP